jgi:hypothetical protein
MSAFTPLPGVKRTSTVVIHRLLAWLGGHLVNNRLDCCDFVAVFQFFEVVGNYLATDRQFWPGKGMPQRQFSITVSVFSLCAGSHVWSAHSWGVRG